MKCQYDGHDGKKSEINIAVTQRQPAGEGKEGHNAHIPDQADNRLHAGIVPYSSRQIADERPRSVSKGVIPCPQCVSMLSMPEIVEFRFTKFT